MYINELLKPQKRQFVNLDEELKNVPVGTGTLKELIDLALNDKLLPLTNSDGRITGISCDYDKGNAIDDAIELEKFKKRYQGKPVMDWALEALKIKHSGRVVASVVEDDGLTTVTYADGEVKEYGYKRTRPTQTSQEPSYGSIPSQSNLPSELDEDPDDIEGYNRVYDVDDSDNINAVKRYLRSNYEHYLNKENPFDLEMDDGRLQIRNINWGRKITN